MVTSAVSVQDALDKLELHVPDLIISETAFPDGDGFELPRRVRATPEWAEIPFIFLTAEAAIENKIRGLELGVDDYLTKPIYIKEIVTRINILLQKRQRTRFEERRDGRTRFAGRVQDMPVVDVIQTIEISRKSGVIQFVGERGRQAAIYFRDGRVIDAEAGTLQGEDAVYRLLTWSEGEFEVVFRTVRRREVITMSSQALLMEGMRRLDEWSRLFEQLPSLTHRFEVDTVELAGRLGDVPDDNNRILRLFDGKRTLLEVIDASDVGDLECLQAISRLYFEELLLDLDHGLDHGRAARRDTGKAMPLVEIEGPSLISDEVSGPTSSAPPAAVEAPDRADAATAPAPTAAALVAVSAAAAEALPPPAAAEALPPPDGDEGFGDVEPIGPLLGGYRPSSLRLIDEAVAAAQAIEPTLFDDAAESHVPDDGHSNGVSRLPVAAGPAPRDADGDGDGGPGPEPPPNAREDSGLRMIGSLGRDRAEASGELATLGQARPIRSETARELVTILPRRITREMPVLPPELADALPTPTSTSPMLAPRSTAALEGGPAVEETMRVARPGSGVRAPSWARRLIRLGRPIQGGGPGMGAMLLILLAVVLAGTAVLLRLRRHVPSAQSTESMRAPSSVVRDAPAPASAARTMSGATGALRDTPGSADTARELPGPAPDTPGTASAVAGSGPAVAAPELPGPSDTSGSAGVAHRALEGAAGSGTAPGEPGAGASPALADRGSADTGAGPRDAGMDDAARGARATAGSGTHRDGADRATEAKALCDQASNALDEGDAARAFELTVASLKLRRTARAYILRARAEQRLNRVDAALASLDAATEIAPSAGAVWEQRGRILWSARRRDEARGAFERFLELDPKSPRAPEVLRLLDEPR